MKKLLFVMLSLLCINSANAVTISAVRPFFWAITCTSRVINSWDYATDVALAAWYATSTPLFVNNPSAIFLTGNTWANIQARWKSLWATKFMTQLQ